ncbi:class I SAM-dependent methyltransferase, partial [Bacillus mycoides]|uniref:class I SAM-dependent methyltransferase n=1 Tax=Bacillus mycoides TaxID=1405 RepID=UPI0028432187
NKIEILEGEKKGRKRGKGERVKEEGWERPRNLHFVSIEGRKEGTYEKLRNEGFENTKTFFSLLGVTYYLTKEELSSLIEYVFEIVPAG